MQQTHILDTSGFVPGSGTSGFLKQKALLSFWVLHQVSKACVNKQTSHLKPLAFPAPMYDFNGLNSQNTAKTNAVMKENECSNQQNYRWSG